MSTILTLRGSALGGAHFIRGPGDRLTTWNCRCRQHAVSRAQRGRSVGYQMENAMKRSRSLGVLALLGGTVGGLSALGPRPRNCQLWTQHPQVLDDLASS